MQTVDLFAGCGGMTRGFLDAEFDILAAYDNWDLALEIYNANFDHPIYNSLIEIVPASSNSATRQARERSLVNALAARP